MAEVLDDPTVTQQDMREMNNMWDSVCQKSVQKQERLDEAMEVCNGHLYNVRVFGKMKLNTTFYIHYSLVVISKLFSVYLNTL